MKDDIQTSFIGLGSNRPSKEGDCLETLIAALKAINEHPLLTVNLCSKAYRSKALGPEQEDYMNAVAKIYCQIEAEELLDVLNEIEARFGRNREQEIRWGPRSLDLDILLFDGISQQSEKLTIPHKELENRSFVIFPLLEIEPELELPNGKKLKSLAENCPQDGIIKTNQTLWQ